METQNVAIEKIDELLLAVQQDSIDVQEVYRLAAEIESQIDQHLFIDPFTSKTWDSMRDVAVNELHKLRARLRVRLEQGLPIQEDTPDELATPAETLWDWDREDHRETICRYIQKEYIEKGKPKKAGVIRAALKRFGLPGDYYGRVRRNHKNRYPEK